MRAYTVATVAVALGVSTKWIDNVLSHNAVPGVTQSRQGITRRLTAEAVSVLEIALRLTRAFGVPVGKALKLAAELTGHPERPKVIEGLEMRIDVPSVRAQLSARLAEAVEFSPIPRRGRPPSRT